LEFPELTIVGGHIGDPWTDEAIALATKHERLCTDTSAYTPARYPRLWWSSCAAMADARCCGAATSR
jgi:predicted TIM-barrel fold metal-dependent hydrolase